MYSNECTFFLFLAFSGRPEMTGFDQKKISSKTSEIWILFLNFAAELESYKKEQTNICHPMEQYA